MQINTTLQVTALLTTFVRLGFGNFSEIQPIETNSRGWKRTGASIAISAFHFYVVVGLYTRNRNADDGTVSVT